jgi:hypothetical protein
MKPLTLILILALIAVTLSSGCLENAPPPKKVVTPQVTSIIPETTLTPVPVLSTPVVNTGTPVQTPVITPVTTALPDDAFVTKPEIEPPNLRILKTVELRPEVGRLIITGIAKNDGKTSVPRAEVQIKFFDANNNLITSSKTSTENFDAGGTWEFTVVYPGPNSGKVSSFKITITEV